MRPFALVFVTLLLFSGCGYHFAGQGGHLPGGLSKIYVAPINNLTSEPYLETKLISRVTDEFARSGQIAEVFNSAAAEAILTLTIRTYSRQAISYDSQDDIAEYDSAMTVDARLIRVKSNQELWQQRISWKSSYSVSSDKAAQDSAEANAIEEICQRLAEELRFRLLSN